MLLEKTQSVEQTLGNLPELRVLTGLQGHDATGKVFDLPEGHKVAAYYYPKADDRLDVIPQLRSENYYELDHRYILGTLSKSLESEHLPHCIWQPRLYKQSGIMECNIVLDIEHKVDENAFEIDQKLWYGGQRLRRDLIGRYHPMIKITNSFFTSSVIEFGVVRVLCGNGMIDTLFSQVLQFIHLEAACLLFKERCEELIQNVVKYQSIERFIESLSQKTIPGPQFLELMQAAAGKKITEAANVKFAIEQTEALSIWVAYNIATYCAAHLVQGHHARTKLSRIMQSYEPAAQEVIDV